MFCNIGAGHLRGGCGPLVRMWGNWPCADLSWRIREKMIFCTFCDKTYVVIVEIRQDSKHPNHYSQCSRKTSQRKMGHSSRYYVNPDNPPSKPLKIYQIWKQIETFPAKHDTWKSKDIVSSRSPFQLRRIFEYLDWAETVFQGHLNPHQVNRHKR